MREPLLAAGAVGGAISWPDLTIVVVYLTFIVSIGVFAGLWRRKGRQSGKGFFLAGGTLTWPIIGLALFSTNISTIHLVSLAQEGYDNGLAYGNFEWMAPFTLIILSLFFAPFYIRARVATLPDFLEMRYSRACRDWLAILSIVSAIFIHLGFSLYTGAIVLRGMFGINLYVSIAVITALVATYTTIGGLLAVVVTESIETVVLILGAICITAIAYYRVGGWSEMVETLRGAGEGVKVTVLRSAEDTSRLPWYSVFLGYPVIGIWYWCADQTIVQRVLGAKDENHARVGPLFAGFIKILPVFIFVLPGLLCLTLVEQGRVDVGGENGLANLEIGRQVYVDGREIPVGAERVELQGKTVTVAGGKQFRIPKEGAHIEGGVLYLKGRPVKETKDIYSFMIREILPPGVRGVVAAALLAALMGTVSGALNSTATLVSYDLVKRWRPATEDRSLVRIGRVVTCVAMVVAILWSSQLEHFKSIFQGINSMISYIAPPITAVFLCGVLWRRASSVAARVTLYAGSALGAIVFVLDWCKESTGWKMPFMMAAFYLFAVCTGMMIVVSLLWPHRHTEESSRLVWGSPLAALRSPGAWRGIGNFRLLAAVLAAVMVALYIVFR
jgi:SSS family solute:Na+ symporter